MMRSNLLLTTLLLLSALYGQASEKIKVACIGNSITYGAAIEPRETLCYPAQLQQMLGDGYTVGNFGRSGATLLNKGHNPYIKTTEFTKAMEFKADIAVIHLGINDTDPRNWPIYRETFIPDYQALIDTLRSTNPAMKIYICRLTPISHRHPRFRGGTRIWHRQIQQAIEQIAAADKSLQLIDLYEVLIKRPELIPDAVHPNAEGAELIARRVYGALTGDFEGLAMSPLFSDNMVLQRSAAGTLIKGRANATELVNITLSGATSGDYANLKASTKTNQNGEWGVVLPLKEAAQGLTLTISTPTKEKVMRNVAVGEVWFISGQSNMSFGVGMSTNGEALKANPSIRLFKATPTFAEQDSLSNESLTQLNQLRYINCDSWVEATASNLNDFSAVGYSFAQRLAKDLKVPIGLIQTSLGGANTEAFIDRQTLEDDPYLLEILYNWRTNPMIMEWCRTVIARGLKGSRNPLQRHFFEPAYLFESRIDPLVDYPIKGVLWYQGESNAEFTELHEQLFPALVKSWREAFANPELPFYFVQLSSLNRPSWPLFRDSQRRLADSIANCEMVVSHDYGDPSDVHPRNKKPIGERLAAVALAHDYGFTTLDWSSPKPLEAIYKDGKVVITLSGKGLRTSDGGALLTFEVADHTLKFKECTAQISGNKVTIDYPSSTSKPTVVRYGWQPYTQANLVSKEGGNPVSTFEIKVK